MVKSDAHIVSKKYFISRYYANHKVTALGVRFNARHLALALGISSNAGVLDAVKVKVVVVVELSFKWPSADCNNAIQPTRLCNAVL